MFKVRHPTAAESQIANLAEVYAAYLPNHSEGAFIEVGAHDGVSWSSTYCLAVAGWRGLLVEAHPLYAALCRQNYAAYPRIEVVQAAVGDQVGETLLYQNGSTSTIKLETIAAYNQYPTLQGQSVEHVLRVPLTTLTALLDGRDWPARYEVLVVDVEGAELDVLHGYSLDRWRPALAIVETHAKLDSPVLSAKAKPINAYFRRHSYCLLQSDEINSLYLSNFSRHAARKG